MFNNSYFEKLSAADIYNMTEFSAAFTAAYILYAITIHCGKLLHIGSISTSREQNGNCSRYRDIPGSICEECYVTDHEYKIDLMDKVEKNHAFFIGHIIPLDHIPFIPYELFRFESFADLVNGVQVVNYFNITAKNSHCHFALWTKNPWIIKNAMRLYGLEKPKNMQIVYSYMMKNGRGLNGKTPEEFTALVKKAYPFIDKVFFVYDQRNAESAGLIYNCSRACYECRYCYTGTGPDTIIEFNKHTVLKDVYKLAGVDVSRVDIEKHLSAGETFIVKPRTIYHVIETIKGYETKPVYKKRSGVPFIGNGRHIWTDAAGAARLNS